MNESKRIFYYDVLRAMAIIGIIFCHVSNAFVSKPDSLTYSSFFVAAFFDCFRDFSVPIFVMLSGALLLNKKDTLAEFFTKRLSRLLVPFVFWAIIYSIYYFVFMKGSVDLNGAVDIFFGTSGTVGVAFWFIWMIIIAYVGIFIINKIIEFGSQKSDMFGERFLVILTFMSLLYICLSQFGLFNPYQSKLIYFASFMSYIVIGYALANYSFLSERIGNNMLLITTFSLSLISYLYYICVKVVPASIASNHFSYSGYFNLLTLFFAANIFLFFKFLSKTEFLDNMSRNNLGNAITLISVYSFGIYLAHYLILFHLRNNLVKYVNYTNQNPLIWIPLLALIVLAISMVILIVLDKIPIIGKVSGRS